MTVKFIDFAVFILFGVLIGNNFEKVYSKDASNSPIVQIPDGKVQGREILIEGSGKSFYAFQGIPFAEPPIGSLRFKPPQPNKRWQGILVGNNNSCVQPDNSGSEDCLYINVYTPKTSKKSLPVLFWIFGGAFLNGDSSLNYANPEFFMEEDEVIFVTFNYRLGVFGFLSTDDLVVPGNMGLKDQVMALKWVHENIAHFGGNPQNVTIAGESAGGASTSYLVQTHLTKGLFQKAIMQSGTSLCLWSLARKAKDMAFAIGKILEVDTTSTTTLIKELKDVSSQDLQDAASKAMAKNAVTENNLQGVGFAPVIEPNHLDALMSRKSHQLLSEGDFHRVPMIIGHNSLEAVAAVDIPGYVKLLLAKYDVFPSKLTPADMNVRSNVTAIAVGNLIKKNYFGLSMELSSNKNLVQFISDDQFNRPTTEAVQLQSKFAPVYFYIFSYERSDSNRSLKGVGHAEEIPFLFKTNKTLASPNDILIKKKMVKLWTNFIKFGNPTPDADSLLDNIIWSQVNSEENKLSYLDIDTNLQMKENPNYDNLNMYKKLYASYGNPPYDTY